MRGYNDSEKPARLDDYDLEKLVGDIVGLVRGLGEERAVLAGHDWGGVISWAVAMREAQVVERLIILNVGHPGAFQKLGFRDPRSWYMFFFLLPEIPEQVLGRNNFEILRRFSFDTAVQKQAFSLSDIEQYIASWRKPGGIKGALNYYRANLSATDWVNLRGQQKFPKIKIPTMHIWGEQDPYLGKELAQGTAEFVSGPYQLHFIPNCGHWVQQEAPNEVNQLMTDFLQDLHMAERVPTSE